MRTTHLNRRRSTAILSAAVLAASGIVASMGAASAVVTGSAGENDQGTPNYYRDGQGMALALCTDANANLCEPPADDHVGVYFAANAADGPWSAGYAVEAINDPVDGLMVFNSTRIRANNVRANTTYRIQDPWGTIRCGSDATGTVDCRRETSGDFTTVKSGHVTTFLHSVARRGADFIGSDALTGQVFGSPTGFNRVKITGGGRTWSTAAFSLMGQKRADTAMSAVNKRALALGNGRQADRITKTIRYSSFGTAAARPTVRKGGPNAAAFSVRDTCASQAPGTGCDIMVTFAPRQHANSVKRAFLTIDDNSLAAPRRVSLRGVGVRR